MRFRIPSLAPEPERPPIRYWRQIHEKNLQKKKFTKEEIKQAFRESKSLDAVARKLGYKDNSGGTHSALKKYVEENNIDISHFTGQG